MKEKATTLNQVLAIAASMVLVVCLFIACNKQSGPYQDTVFIDAVHRQYRHFELIPNHAQLVAWMEDGSIAVRCQPGKDQLPIGVELVDAEGKVHFQQHFPSIKPKGVIDAPIHRISPGPYDLQVYFDNGEMLKTWLTVP